MQTELRFYVVNLERLSDKDSQLEMTEGNIMELAEQQGGVYTIKTFNEVFNNGGLNTAVHYLLIKEVGACVADEYISDSIKYRL